MGTGKLKTRQNTTEWGGEESGWKGMSPEVKDYYPCRLVLGNPMSAAKVISRELSQGLSLGRSSGFYGLRLQF